MISALSSRGLEHVLRAAPELARKQLSRRAISMCIAQPSVPRPVPTEEAIGILMSVSESESCIPMPGSPEMVFATRETSRGTRYGGVKITTGDDLLSCSLNKENWDSARSGIDWTEAGAGETSMPSAERIGLMISETAKLGFARPISVPLAKPAGILEMSGLVNVTPIAPHKRTAILLPNPLPIPRPLAVPRNSA